MPSLEGLTGFGFGFACAFVGRVGQNASLYRSRLCLHPRSIGYVATRFLTRPLFGELQRRRYGSSRRCTRLKVGLWFCRWITVEALVL